MLLHAFQETVGDLLAGFEVAAIGAVVAAFFVYLEARKERRDTIRLQRREWKVASTKNYAALGSAPLAHHYEERP